MLVEQLLLKEVLLDTIIIANDSRDVSSSIVIDDDKEGVVATITIELI